MNYKLLSALLVSSVLLVAGQASADEELGKNSILAAAPPSNAMLQPKRQKNVVPAPTKAKTHKKAKAPAPVATAKGSQANITGPGTITGPIDLAGGAAAAPAPAPAAK